MKFYAHHFFSTLRIFCVEMATSEGGGDLHIRSWETTKIALKLLGEDSSMIEAFLYAVNVPTRRELFFSRNFVKSNQNKIVFTIF